jgi:hypothetical protein
MLAFHAGVPVDEKNLKVAASIGLRKPVICTDPDPVGPGGLSAGGTAAQHQGSNG